jgi:hypothetical protein
MMSEKDMEDQIAEHPEKFIGEKGLFLVARQFHLGSYIFDLMFEDRHGAKLIVEIQKGTLDRNHTYKILDYYDEYRESHPHEFIEIMVIANQISAERKKRLHALGVEFLELPEQRFESGISSEIFDEISRPPRAMKTQADSSMKEKDSSRDGSETSSYYFRSLGNSAFISSVREAISSSSEFKNWKTGGHSSLTAIFLPASEAIEKKIGVGLKAQIWMERPKSDKGACKFEVAYSIADLSVEKNKALRERIAASMRLHLAMQLPGGIKLAGGSTVVKCLLDLPGIKDVIDDRKENLQQYSSECQRILEFLKFLDTALVEWTERKFKQDF